MKVMNTPAWVSSSKRHSWSMGLAALTLVLSACNPKPETPKTEASKPAADPLVGAGPQWDHARCALRPNLWPRLSILACHRKLPRECQVDSCVWRNVRSLRVYLRSLGSTHCFQRMARASDNPRPQFAGCPPVMRVFAEALGQPRAQYCLIALHCCA